MLRERSGHHLAIRSEAAKIALSDTPRVDLDLDVAEVGLHVPVSRAAFEDAIAAEIARVGDAALACVAQAGLAPSAVDTLFFTGGSSGVPALRQALAARFPDAQPVEGDLYGSVGCGLAVVARQRYGGA